MIREKTRANISIDSSFQSMESHTRRERKYQYNESLPVTHCKHIPHLLANKTTIPSPPSSFYQKYIYIYTHIYVEIYSTFNNIYIGVFLYSLDVDSSSNISQHFTLICIWIDVRVYMYILSSHHRYIRTLFVYIINERAQLPPISMTASFT